MKHSILSLASLLTRYLPALVLSIILLVAFGQEFVASMIACVFFLLQMLYIFLIDRFPNGLPERLNLDFAPPAGIILAYYVSFPSAVIVSMMLMLVYDLYSLDVSVFSEIEDAVFTLIVAALAAMLRGSFEFLSLAVVLIFVRYFLLTIVHGALTRDFNPKKFMAEGTGALIFIFAFRALSVFA